MQEFSIRGTPFLKPFFNITIVGAALLTITLVVAQVDPNTMVHLFAALQHPLQGDIELLWLGLGFSACAAVVLFCRLAGWSAIRERTVYSSVVDTEAQHYRLHGAVARLRFETALAAAAEGANGATLMLLDVDGFRSLLSEHGTHTAHELLARIGDRLAAIIPAGAVLAGLESDEFAVLVQTLDGAIISRLATAIRNSLLLPFVMNETVFEVTLCIGACRAPADGRTPAALLRAGRLAVAKAKQAGGGIFRMFEPEIGAVAQARRMLRAELRRAVANREFVPYYQPIVSLSTGKIVSLEVLARWNHPERGLLPPDQFISSMEEQNLCGPLSLDLLQQVVVDARCWPRSWTFAFNASAGQLRDLLDFARNPVAVAGVRLDPRRVELEVTETVLIDDMDLARQLIQVMHRHGVKTVLDDFGTGYANVTHLRDLPFDKIKVDRSFVKDLLLSARSHACLHAMLGLARSLGASVVAEGVEDEATAQKLREMGCDFAQGYHYSRPVPASAVPSLITHAAAA